MTDVVVAAGVQNMSMIPISSAMTVTEGMGLPEIFAGSEGWLKRYGDQEISQFRGADLIAEQWDISREDMEAFAVESHERAIRATAEGRFEREIVPVNGLTRDEGPREPNWEKIRSLPTLREGGRITAAVASQISDASAAMLIASRAGREGPRPHAPGPHPPPVGARRGPGEDAVGADPRHPVRAREGRHDDGRHRPRRDQRGVRLGGARLAEGHSTSTTPRSTSTAAPSPSATRSAPPACG